MGEPPQEHIVVAVRMRPMNAREVSSLGRGSEDVVKSRRYCVLEVQSGCELY